MSTTSSPIVKATLQNAVISASSNILAQFLSAYRTGRPFSLDTQALLQFTTCAIIQSPLGFLWLEMLESMFPSSGSTGSTSTTTSGQGIKGKEKSEDSSSQISIRNTLAKVVIDQTIGAAWNTVLFISTISMLRGLRYDGILEQVKTEFWPLLTAGLKLWPFVSLLNFTVVPVDKRLLVGSLFGLLWGVYLSLMAA